MTNPFKCKRMLVKVSGQTVGVVEGMGIEFIREGGVEPHYSSETGKHAVGTKRGTFSIRRWMYIDTHKKLLWDLFDDSTPFSLEFGISDMQPVADFVAGTRILLSDCLAYRWRPITGAANDIIAEECSGEFTDWDDTNFSD